MSMNGAHASPPPTHTEDVAPGRASAVAPGASVHALASLAMTELRRRLESLLGMAHVMSNQRDEGLRSAMASVERGGLAMAKVIEDWQAASRLLVGTTVLDRTDAHIDVLAREVVDGRRRAIEATDRSIDVEAEPAIAWVDEVRVREMVERMLDRMERTTPGGGAIVLRVERMGDDVLLSVEGHGGDTHERSPGRTSTDARRVHAARRPPAPTPHERTLTLAIVRALAELHGGTAGADRADDRFDDRIWALLPRVHTHDGARDVPVDLSGVSVLLVDDTDDALELAAAIVRLRGATASLAHSAAEALTWLEDHPVDVLVSDIAMPHEDGCSLVRQALALRPELRAAALSAHVHVEERERALAAGFETYLTKPIDPDELARVVRSLAHPIPPRRASREPRSAAIEVP
jgi:CheY-like chemotaxis protein